MSSRDTRQNSGVLSLDLGTAFRLLIKGLKRTFGKRLSGSIVTLDIDDAGVKLLEIKGGVIRKWAQVAIPGDTTGTFAEREEAEVLSREKLRDAVKQVMAASGTKLGRVRASVSGLFSISRILPLPIVPPEVSAREFVQGMVEDALPLSVNRMYVSWEILERLVSEDSDKVFAIGVPRSLLENEIRGLRAAGANPRVLELRSAALARMVRRKQAIIVNMEPSSVDIIIVVNGVPEIMHNVPWAEGAISLEEKVEQVAVNTRLAVDFRNSRSGGLPVDENTPLFFTGQISGDMELIKRLGDRLDYPVESVSPWFQCPPELPVSQYAVNIGLALRGMELPDDSEEEGYHQSLDINLLPVSYNPWRPTARQAFSLLTVLAAVALLFPFFSLTTEAMSETARLEVKNEALNGQLEIKKAEIKRREPVQAAVSEYKDITRREGSFVADIEAIWDKAEALDVEVRGISHDGQKITFFCQAPDFRVFREYLTALEESGRFKSPIPPPERFPYVKEGDIELEVAADG